MQGTLDNDGAMLGAYPVEDYMRLQVTDTNPHRVKNQYTDVSLVEKFELTEDEYEKRTGKEARHKHERREISNMTNI